MAITSITALVGVVGEARLLDPPQQDELVRQLQRQYADPKALAKALIERGWLTTFQIKQLVQGKGGELVLGQYVLLDVIGEGGMGKVFKARQRSLGRIVALKVIRQERLTNVDAVRRFQREIQATSQLSHPNIVRAVDADQVGDTSFIAMEYVEGIDLAKLVKRDGPLPIGQACDFIRQGALGLQHAHECGLVHRDIKPSNLMVARTGPQGAGFGLVKLLDLGLARAVEPTLADMTATLTHAGCVIGTPDYISPEQARDSRTVDIRADIYSLGCTLYYVLTGQVPFPGGTGMEKLFKHQLETPAPLPQLRSGLPRALVSAVGALMAKKVEDRPQTPAEVARLLQAFSQGEPNTAIVRSQALKPTQTMAAEVDTTPRSFRTRGQAPQPAATPGKWQRRLLAGVAGLGLLLTTGLAALFFLGGSTDSPGTNANTGTNPGPTEPLVKSGTSKVSSKSTERQPKFGLDQLDASRIPAAERVPDLPTEAVGVLGEQRFRHWGQMQGFTFSPDGKTLATIGSDKQLRVWNVSTGEQKAAFALEAPQVGGVQLCFSPNGQTITLHSVTQGLRVLDLNSGKQIFSVPNPKVEGRVLAVSPDAQTAIVAGGGLERGHRLWHLGRNAEVRPLEGITFGHGFAFSSDGKWVAAWVRYGAKNDVTLWETTGNREPLIVPLGGEQLLGLAVHAAGTNVTVAAVTMNGQLKFWNTANLAEPTVRELPGGKAYYLAFAPDGKTLAISGTGAARLHNVATGQEKTFIGPSAVGGQLHFSPDGRTIATGGGLDSQIRLWEVATGQELRPSQGHGGFISVASFVGDGRMLVASSSYPGGVKVWDVLSGKLRLPIGEPAQGNLLLAINPEQQTVLTRSTVGLALWDLNTGTRVAAMPLTAPASMGAAATPNGDTVATLISGQLKIWDGRKLVERTTLAGATQSIYTLALSADGQKLAGIEYSNTGMETRTARVRLWSLTDNKELPPRPNLVFKGGVSGLAFSPDGQLLAVHGMDGSMKVCEVSSGRERFTYQDPAPRPGLASHVAFSADGKSVAVWGQGGVKVWDVASGKERPTPKAFQEGISAFAFTPDSKLLAACDRTGRIVSWNAATGAEVQRIQLPGAALGLTFAADSKHLATSNSNGTFYILRLSAP